MANILRQYGILSDDGDTLYGFSSLDDLLNVAFDEDGPSEGQTLIRIDAFTVLAEGSDEKSPDKGS